MSLRPLVFVAALVAAAGLAAAQQPAGSPSKPVPAKKTEPKPAEDKAAEGATLKVGSKAPAIKADKWVKGTEVKSFESGKVYVVEFWATWCPPCRESIPHLTKLQKEHKELTVVGMASSEKQKAKGPGAADTRLENLEKFVKDQGENMDYTVAYDGSRTMGKDWLEAAGQKYIPVAFVVGADGNIAYIGNPLDKGFEPAVDKALKAAGGGASTPSKPEASKPADTHSKPQQPKPKS